MYRYNPLLDIKSSKTQSNRNALEDAEQEALIEWSLIQKLPDMPHIEKGAVINDYLYAIPNGGKRDKGVAVKLKKQGVKAGVSDLHLALPMFGLPGLWIEMKQPNKSKADTSPKQKAWLARMKLAGYVVVIAYGWDEAKAAIENYLYQRTQLRRAA